jgi:hypothetical protein
MPGRKGAKVYRWEDVDGFFLRTRVNWGKMAFSIMWFCISHIH